MSGRILFIDQSGQPGGAELCLADIAQHFRKNSSVLLLSDGPFAGLLRERGLKVRILQVAAGLAAVEKQAGMAALVRAALNFPRAVLALRRHARNADLLYLNTPKALVLGVLASIGTGRKLVFHLHDFIDTRHFSCGNIWLLIAAANRTTAVIANSLAVASAFEKAGGRAASVVIPNGFTPEPFDAVEAVDCAAIQQQWNPQGLPVAAVFGRIARWKGQDVLLRAAAEVPGLMVWIVGAPLFTADDRNFQREIEELAATPELRGRVVFCGQREDVPAIMRAADIIVHTSVAPEPFGRVIVEGMLAGKPVVAADAGGPAEIIEHAITGWLVPPGNAALLAIRLRQLLADPEGGREAGRRGARAARERYSLPRVMDATEKVLTPLLSQ